MGNDCNEYEVTCIDGPGEMPSTTSWVLGFALVDYVTQMIALGWRRVEACLVPDHSADWDRRVAADERRFWDGYFADHDEGVL